MTIVKAPAKGKLLIYGATGYTGTIICTKAARLGLKVVIAGSIEEKLSALSQQLNILFHVFSVKDKPGWEKSVFGKMCFLTIALSQWTASVLSKAIWLRILLYKSKGIPTDEDFFKRRCLQTIRPYKGFK